MVDFQVDFSCIRGMEFAGNNGGDILMRRSGAKIILEAAIILITLSAVSEAQWNLFLQGSLVTGGNPHDLVVIGDYAYLGDWGAGMSVIDISNPLLPESVSNYNTLGLANSVFIAGNLALVADWSHGISIIDITDPASPEFLSSWDSPGAVYNIYESGGYAYLADFNGGLIVLDISDPANPGYVTAVGMDGLATGIWGTGNYIYVADYPTGILTFDIYEPGIPQITDTYTSSGSAFNITGSGDHIFLADGSRGVKILTIENPSDPVLVSAVTTIGYVNDVAISDTLMFTAEDSAGVSVFSIANIEFPYFIANYDTPRRAKGIFARGRYVYVGDAGSFLILLLDDGTTGIDDDRLNPVHFSLESVYPNPFNPEAAIEFSLSENARMTLEVYNVIGERIDLVFDRKFEAGVHTVTWNGRAFPSGVYFFKLKGDGVSSTIKATLLK